MHGFCKVFKKASCLLVGKTVMHQVDCCIGYILDLLMSTMSIKVPRYVVKRFLEFSLVGRA